MAGKFDASAVSFDLGRIGSVPINCEMWDDKQLFVEAVKKHIDEWFRKHIVHEMLFDVPITLIIKEDDHA